MDYDISVVLGSKNRKNLLKATINSIRKNGFHGNLEIIVIDGGFRRNSCFGSFMGDQQMELVVG